MSLASLLLLPLIGALPGNAQGASASPLSGYRLLAKPAFSKTVFVNNLVPPYDIPTNAKFLVSDDGTTAYSFGTPSFSTSLGGPDMLRFETADCSNLREIAFGDVRFKSTPNTPNLYARYTGELQSVFPPQGSPPYEVLKVDGWSAISAMTGDRFVVVGATGAIHSQDVNHAKTSFVALFHLREEPRFDAQILISAEPGSRIIAAARAVDGEKYALLSAGNKDAQGLSLSVFAKGKLRTVCRIPKLRISPRHEMLFDSRLEKVLIADESNQLLVVDTRSKSIVRADVPGSAIARKQITRLAWDGKGRIHVGVRKRYEYTVSGETDKRRLHIPMLYSFEARSRSWKYIGEHALLGGSASGDYVLISKGRRVTDPVLLLVKR